MELKEHSYKIKGMNMDLSNSIFSPEFSWKNKNIRLTIRGANDTLLVSNERGNKVLSVNEYFRDPSGVTFIYTPAFYNYVNTISLPRYSYNPTFSGYVNQIADPTYSYATTFYGYRNVASPPSYSYSPTFSNYKNTLIDQ